MTEVTTPMDENGIGALREAFHHGNVVDVVSEHEGMSQTLIYEVPGGHFGVTLGAMPGDGDLHVSVSTWEKEPHHELDEWVWQRVDAEDYR